jgi:hypothetical protein
MDTLQDTERWVEIPGFNGRYSLSNHGRVKSHEKFIKTQVHKRGSVAVRLFQNCEYQTKYVHRLVAETFIPNPENKDFVTHIDYDRKNNHLENLMWCTKKEIIDRARNAGRFNINSNRVTVEKIEFIKRLHEEGRTYREIAEEVGLTKVTVAKYVRL